MKNAHSSTPVRRDISLALIFHSNCSFVYMSTPTVTTVVPPSLLSARKLRCFETLGSVLPTAVRVAVGAFEGVGGRQ